MIPSLEGWPTKAKEAPSPHEVRMSPLDTNPVFQSLGVETLSKTRHERYIPNSSISILVTFRFSTSSNQRDRIKPLLL